MRKVEDLTRPELRQIVQQLQELLFLDSDKSGKRYWNPDKEWDTEYLESLATALQAYGLVPTELTRIPPLSTV